MGSFRTTLIAALVAPTAGALPAPASAQNYPNKPIRIVSYSSPTRFLRCRVTLSG